MSYSSKHSVAGALLLAASLVGAGCSSDNGTTTPIATGGTTSTGGTTAATGGATAATGGTTAGACTPSTAVARTIAVTTPGDQFFYVFDGGTDHNPALTVTRGKTYVFNLSTASIHPFAIVTSKTPNVLPAPLDTAGVSGNNNSSTGTITFTVPCDAPDALAYECTVHGFGNTITVVGP